MLSPNLMLMFESPVPIFMGVLNDIRFFDVESLYENYPHILFVEINVN